MTEESYISENQEIYFSVSNDHYKLWDPNNPAVINFFSTFPIKNKHDSEIAQCDLDILTYAILYFSKKTNQDNFVEEYIKTRTANRYFDLEYVDKVEIPYYYFKGYFHPMFGAHCLESVRIGNPKDPMYKYSYEFPSTRTYSIEDAFEKGAIPCPKCYLNELLEIYQGDSENFES